MTIAKHKVVSIDYKLTDRQGQVLDSSEGKEPLAYLHGVGGIIPGLESALEGKATGDELTIKIDPEEAYGPKRDELIQDLPKNMFPEDAQVQVGMHFKAETQAGEQMFRVVDVDEETVKVDANHPLAGMELTFDVAVKEVRDATAEEIDHGHVYGSGAHEH